MPHKQQTRYALFMMTILSCKKSAEIVCQVSRDLTEKNLKDRIFIRDSLDKRNEETPFLKQVIFEDSDGRWQMDYL